MVNENSTAEEWLKYFWDKLNNGETVTVSDLRDAVKTISVKDPVAAKDAVTVFYSGEGSSFPKGLFETAGSGIRMIDRTEACKFLADDRFQEIFRNVVELEFSEEMKVSNGFSNLQKRFLYNGSSGSVAEGTWEASESFWSIVSRRFASETSGDAYALVSNALPDRIFATDELKTLLETLPDEAKICGFNTARGVVAAA